MCCWMKPRADRKLATYASPNAFTGSAEMVLTRKRVARPHEKRHAYCNIIAGIDRRFGTRGVGGGCRRPGPTRAVPGLSLVPRCMVGSGLGRQLGLGALPRRPLVRR